MSIDSNFLSVSRHRGLGNVINLLPVLKKMYNLGLEAELITNSNWHTSLQETNPWLNISAIPRSTTINLDLLTEKLYPSCHRSDEFGKILGVEGPFERPFIRIPQDWDFAGYGETNEIAFCPEASHPARIWPLHHAQKFSKEHFELITLLGLNRHTVLYSQRDLRGNLDIKRLIVAIAESKVVVTMDSACLHLGLALNRPTIAIFSGVDPEYRTRSDNKCIALQAKLECCPCNKKETCDSRYDCLHQITPAIVSIALRQLPKLKGRKIIVVGNH